MVERRSERQHRGRRRPGNRECSHALLLLSCSTARSAVSRHLELATCRQLERCQLDLMMHVMGYARAACAAAVLLVATMICLSV